MFYVIAEAAALGLRLVPEEGREIARVSSLILAAAREQLPVVHPDNPGFAGVSIAQLSGPPLDEANQRRNVVTIATGGFAWDQPASWTGVIDRSPCGTGTCAKMAVLHARGELGLHQDFRHEGILGTVFTGRLVEETTVGAYPAVIPTLSGQAWITGLSTYTLDPTDPFQDGYRVGDLW